MVSYPPTASPSTNALQQALERRDTMMTVQLEGAGPSSATAVGHDHDHDHASQVPGDEAERAEAMRLKGGCIDLSPCG
ncbi:hypothetical protein JCM10212_005612, partial [Sporobolomyces blumeae]